MSISKGNVKLAEWIKAFKIFCNQHRLSILKLLKERGEKSVGQIADRLGISFNTVSKNLLYLESKGILIRRYDGPFVLYKISNSISKPVDTLISVLDQ